MLRKRLEPLLVPNLVVGAFLVFVVLIGWGDAAWVGLAALAVLDLLVLVGGLRLPWAPRFGPGPEGDDGEGGGP
jgi:hypothetical protein